MEEIVLSHEEYTALFEESTKYQALIRNGVDKWEKFDQAMDEADEILIK